MDVQDATSVCCVAIRGFYPNSRRKELKMSRLVSALCIGICALVPSITVAADTYYIINPHSCITSTDGLKRCPDKETTSCVSPFVCTTFLPVTGVGCEFPNLQFIIAEIEAVGDSDTTVTEYVENTSTLISGNAVNATLPEKICYKERVCLCEEVFGVGLCTPEEFGDVHVLIQYEVDLEVHCVSAPVINP